MTNKITNFSITNLHNRNVNIDMPISDNTIILVGENGSGKTTILQMFYYLISGQFKSLLNYEFDSIGLKYEGKEYSLSKKDISIYQLLNSDRPFLRRGIHFFRSEEEEDDDDDYNINTFDYRFFKTHIGKRVSARLTELSINDEEVQEHLAQVKQYQNNVIEKIPFQVLYLPTYRRIEQELQFIFKHLDSDSLRKKITSYDERLGSKSSVELVEFGMRDVQRLIEQTLTRLNRQARIKLDKLSVDYLSDILEQRYINVDLKAIKEATDNTIENVLSRIKDRSMTKTNKEQLYNSINKVREDTELSQHDKIVCHYFTKVMRIQHSLQLQEKAITQFCEICNSYMANKKFSYSSSDFSFKIYQEIPSKNRKTDIELHQLSSGEKQIVSLFCHLFLSGFRKGFFVIIDEPELSLSVEWQRKFLLDIHSGDFCSGLFAVTHSPFIYDNNLKPFAHGIGEFLS